ncbi:ROK family protein [Nocardioides sp. BP30]|uniref:ROK family protein n=1 Tax=Nocardioides sp. BP30 TaxID=3036374 RepID=UPI0024697C8B|nr:ROK family protein [Nocardioides sp. BP30]WGL52179.1 ROK family protein [Nocardioides sp. BP30]
MADTEIEGGEGRAAGSREQNLGALFEAVLTRGPLSRRDAARVTGLSPASVTKLVKPMITHGYLVERHREAGVPGRPQIPLQVVPERHYAVGVKLMEGELVGVMADLHAEVQSAHRMRYDDTSPAGVVAAVASLTEVLLERSPAARDRLLGIGIGLGGHVDGASGLVVHAPFLGWRDVPLQQMVADRLGIEVVLENDVNTLAVAEQWFGPGFAFDSFAVVTLGVGVGCAFVLDGKLWRGARGAAGELGHMVVVPDGPPCHCGKRGCLEAVVGDEAIVAAMSARSGRRYTTVSQVIAAAHAGDEHARGVFAEAGVGVGRALAALVNLLNPPLVILSGEGIAASDLLMDALRAELERDSFSTSAQDCTLLVRPLPDETWARGAAATMIRRGVLRSLSRLSDQVVG